MYWPSCLVMDMNTLNNNDCNVYDVSHQYSAPPFNLNSNELFILLAGVKLPLVYK